VFDNLKCWTGISQEQLASYTMKSFGMDIQDAQTRDELFQWSAAGDLVRETDGDMVRYMQNWVEGELVRCAPAINRAIFVLRMQAATGPHDVSGTPPLLGEIYDFLKEAVQMTRGCNGLPDDSNPVDWYDACDFFKIDLLESSFIPIGPSDHYEKESWKALCELWGNNRNVCFE
jgi:hypothetical protein